MKKENFFNLVKQLHLDCVAILERKANDYATETDVLSAFKLAALITKLDVNKVFLAMCVIKMLRLAELTEGNKEVKNESVDDTFKDFVNYLTLWYVKRHEQ